MITARTRAILDRYSLATRALTSEVGERMSREAGQSVEFHDFRQYQPGDELRYVDWRAYARTGRLYTRLHQAELAIRLHVLVDTSASMSLFGKDAFARTAGELIVYTARKEGVSQTHTFSGASSRPSGGVRSVLDAARLLDAAPEGGPAPMTALTEFAGSPVRGGGRALLVVISDLLDPEPPRPALAALRARGFDVSFLQVLAEDDLNPGEALLELTDAETGSKLEAGPAEVRAYRQAIRQHVARTRSAIVRAGFRHLLLRVPPGGGEPDREAFRELLRAGIIVRR